MIKVKKNASDPHRHIITYRQAGLLMQQFGYRLPGIGREIVLANVEGRIRAERIHDRDFAWTFVVKIMNNGDGTYTLIDGCDYLSNNGYITLKH